MDIIDQFLGIEAGNFVQFVKYSIGGGIATLTHNIVFNLVAWKIFFALQADDWFVKFLNLPQYLKIDRLYSTLNPRRNRV